MAVTFSKPTSSWQRALQRRAKSAIRKRKESSNNSVLPDKSNDNTSNTSTSISNNTRRSSSNNSSSSSNNYNLSSSSQNVKRIGDNDNPTVGDAYATNPLTGVNNKRDSLIEDSIASGDWTEYDNFQAKQSPLHYEKQEDGNFTENKNYWGNLIENTLEEIKSGDNPEIWRRELQDQIQQFNNAPGETPYVVGLNSNSGLANKYGVEQASDEWFNSEYNSNLAQEDGISERRHWSENPYYQENPDEINKATTALQQYGSPEQIQASYNANQQMLNNGSAQVMNADYLQAMQEFQQQQQQQYQQQLDQYQQTYQNQMSDMQDQYGNLQDQFSQAQEQYNQQLQEYMNQLAQQEQAQQQFMNNMNQRQYAQDYSSSYADAVASAPGTENEVNGSENMNTYRYGGGASVEWSRQQAFSRMLENMWANRSGA